MMDAEQRIKLRDALQAALDLGALIGSGQAQVDEQGPKPGSRLARVSMVLALLSPAHNPRRPSKQ